MNITIHQSRPHPQNDRLELVLAELIKATYQPYVVWMHNLLTDSMNHGDYYGTLAEAQAGFEERFQRIEKRSLHRAR